MPGRANDHKQMIRKTTVLSDTDSVIFSNASWTKWLTGKTKISKESNAINAMIVFLLSKLLVHVFQYTSACVNISTEDLRGINMKNEFNYPVFIASPLAKHYMGLVAFREGNKLLPFKFDLKGLNYKSSNIAGEVIDRSHEFFKKTMYAIYEKTKLRTKELLREAVEFELAIVDNILEGDASYLFNYTFSGKGSTEQYKDIYNFVFDKKVALPARFNKVPIKPIKGITFDPKKYGNTPEAQKLKTVLMRNPRKVLRLMHFPVNEPMPELIKQLISLDSIIATNCGPLYLFMRSLGIVNLSSTKTKRPYYKQYKSITEEIRNGRVRQENERAE
jgi:hypothetical protein